jgi:hypothetical protein
VALIPPSPLINDLSILGGRSRYATYLSARDNLLTDFGSSFPSHVLRITVENSSGFSLSARLLRAGLHDAITIGGYENLYRARTKEWVLHINLVIIGGTKAAIDKFQVSFSDADIERPVMKMAANDLPKQLSYVLKFTTYHRPYRQRGAVKSPARPLNVAEHLALVRWMAERNFRDFVFLFNARRSVDSIVPHKSRD